MTKMENMETLFKNQPLLLEHFCDQQKLDSMKNILIRYSIEEALRRVIPKHEEHLKSENILNTLFHGHQEFYDTLYQARVKEIEAAFAPKSDAEEFEKYEAEVARVSQALGYSDLPNVSNLALDDKMISAPEPAVDFGLAVSNLVMSKPW